MNADEMMLVVFGMALAVGAYLLYRLVSAGDNSLNWADLIASNGSLNAYKLGYWVAMGVGSWAVVKAAYLGVLDGAILAAYLGFAGGVPVVSGALGGRPPRKFRVDDPDRR